MPTGWCASRLLRDTVSRPPTYSAYHAGDAFRLERLQPL
uniref:Uncharacterized protein n=1 Tax=Myoviridae sp. ctCjb12 TaxID=2826631 RepID=A0A8S5MQ95_9CAUD|nr:MAG TPA: hypothetical protein [Myoviridae sp. ctCjb12]